MIRIALVAAFLSISTGCYHWGFSTSTGEDTRTPLEKAAMNGDAVEVRRLLAAGANVNEAGLTGSPLNTAVSRSNNVEIIRMLIAAGANPNGQPGHPLCSPLSNAASRGDLDNLRALLDAGATLRHHGCGMIAGWLTPPVLELLAPHGLDLKAVDERGRNALHEALQPPFVARCESIEYLIRAGVPVNARDRSGKTPLAYWREPRDFETHWFREWILSGLGDNPELKRSSTDRARISALLERSGATL